VIPYRGRFGDPRPERLNSLLLPPEPMPSHLKLRPLKAWRYVGVFGPDLMLCAASVRIGPARQAFWAVWDRTRIYERTTLGHGRVTVEPEQLRVRTEAVQIDLTLAETAGIETVCPSGGAYAWTRKQIAHARGRVMLDGEPHQLDATAIIDDTAAYYERHTRWRWCAGVGTTTDGKAAAWNLVQGVNDPDENSERTVWIDGEPSEPPPNNFAPDLTKVDDLNFHAEATRERNENLLLIRSRYRQPFGTFTGRLPNGEDLREGYGVMEDHDVRW
jgi:hypothetical protein